MPSQDVLLNLTQMILLRLHPILVVRIRELRYDVNQRGVILFWIPKLVYFNLTVLIFLVSVHYIKHPSMGCFDTRGALPILTSKNLNDAKIECSKHPQCYMFRDKCGDESEFSYCTKTATLKTSKASCGSNLYRPGNLSMWHINYCINI